MIRFWMLAGIALILLAGCSDDDNPVEPITTPAYTDSLQFSIGPMGSTPLVCCGLYDPGFVNEKALRLVFWDPALQKPGWQLLILVDRAAQGEVATLPTSVVPPSKIARISMFVTGGGEWSSDAIGSTGTITVHSFQCTSHSIEIDFSVDATLQSETSGGGSITVTGRFHGSFPPASCS